MKKYIIQLLVFGFTLFALGITSTAVSVISDSSLIELKINSTFYKANGKAKTLDVEPMIYQNRTMIPLRFLIENLGGDVTWDKIQNKIILNLDGRTIELKLNQRTAYVNSKEIELEVAPLVILGRSMLPLRFISENLGCEVTWKESSKEVIIQRDKVNIPNEILKNHLLEQVNLTSGSLTRGYLSTITEISLDKKNIDSIEGIQYCKNLLYLSLQGNNIKDFSPISDLVNLNYLLIGNTYDNGKIITSNTINNTSIFNKLINIKSLFVDGLSFTDINFVKQMKNLTFLVASYNRLKEIGVLSDMNNLEQIFISNNFIQNISPLSGASNLSSLYINDNMISDFSPLFGLSQMKTLYIEDNNLRDLSQIKTLCKLKNLEKLDLWGYTKPSDVLSEAAKIDAKCNDIISRFVKPEMTLVEKELVLHDYLTTITKYDKDYKKYPDNTRIHSPMGLLFDGLCVCDGYAKTFNILLAKAGIPSMYYVGNSYGTDEIALHAWNIVTIDGKSYNVDLTWNDLVETTDEFKEKMLFSHQYFNKSDEAFQNDHEIIADRGITCPESYPVQYTEYYKVQNYKSSNVDRTDDGLRFTNMENSKNLVLSDKVSSFAIHGEYIYYTNDDSYLMRSNIDGKDIVKLSDYEIYNINIFNERIYYIKYLDSKGSSLCSNDLYFENELVISTVDESPNYFTIYNDFLFYSTFNETSLQRYIKEYHIPTGQIYAFNETKPAGFVFRINAQRTSYTLSYSFSQNFMISNNYLYYQKADDLNDGKSIVRMQLQQSDSGPLHKTSEQVQLYAGDSRLFEIVGDYIYFINKSNTMRIKNDKSDLTYF